VSAFSVVNPPPFIKKKKYKKERNKNAHRGFLFRFVPSTLSHDHHEAMPTPTIQ